MPIYMDRHEVPGITAKDVAEAHKQDLEVQDQFNCRALTYWFDEERGTAFCLFEAPNKQAVEELHNHSHGLLPHNIIEVDDTLVEAFLGRIDQPGSAEHTGEEELVFDEPALRTIMVLELQGNTALKYKAGMEKYYTLIRKCNEFLETEAQKYNGEVISTDKEDNISQIAFKTGFNNPSYFSKCFRERYGIQPSAYRELFIS